jgi:hypothetical protein
MKPSYLSITWLKTSKVCAQKKADRQARNTFTPSSGMDKGAIAFME